MGPELGAWIVKGMITAVMMGLGYAVRSLFVRLSEAQERLAALETQAPGGDLPARLAALEARPDPEEVRAELHRHKLCVAEGYIRRDDYVVQMSGVLAKLDAIGVMVARVDERMRVHEGATRDA